MIDWHALGYDETALTQGGGIAYIAVSLIVVYWMWQAFREE